jgi:hypothetical protein
LTKVDRVGFEPKTSATIFSAIYTCQIRSIQIADVEKE